MTESTQRCCLNREEERNERRFENAALGNQGTETVPRLGAYAVEETLDSPRKEGPQYLVSRWKVLKDQAQWS